MVSTVLSWSLGQAAGQDTTNVEFFEKRIRPVLVENCYECHSGRAKKVQGGLRLDSRPAIRQGGTSGPALIPKAPNDSLIIAALRHESLEMPPDKKLPAEVVANFVRWIESGATDPRDEPDAKLIDVNKASKDHWAFQPIRRPHPPELTSADAKLTPVDRFVVARLREAGLTLSPPADPATLVRRAYFDLIGLPPTPEEVAAFENQSIRNSQSAFRNLVDRLLDSPHYGERWGRYWLDVARYADNKGYVFFEEKNYPWAWTYRDYVIRALNEDLPFDQFVIQQLAADQLELGDDRRPLAAMGFLTLGPRFMNNTHDVLDDRIDVVTRGLLGLTVTCARCHDHKFDPVTTEDYYSLYGVFRSSVEPLLPPEFTTATDSDERRKFEAGMQQRLANLETFIAARREQIIGGGRSRAAEYLLAVHAKRNQPPTENFMLLTDKGALNPAMIQRWEVYLKRARRAADPVWTVWHAFSQLPDEGFAEAAADLHVRLLAKDSTVKINPLVARAFAGQPPADMKQVAQRYGGLFARIDQRWRDDSAESKSDALAEEDAEAIRQVLYGPGSPPMIPRELSWGFLDLLPDRPTQDAYKKLLKEVESWSINQPAAPPRAMVLVDAATPYDPCVFIRGNPHREGPAVPRQFLGLLAGPNRQPFSHGSGRLELARKIVAADNPLTARVLVNRVWMHHFGRGLVATPSDFGFRGEPPTHPDLLDWLATTLIDSGWSIKQLHRTIMNSAVYQMRIADCGMPNEAPSNPQSAFRNPQSIDPENKLLWRFPRRRLDFEATRDALLAVSGSLDRRLGGPPVNVLDGFTPRRTVYGFIDRMDLPGLMRTFDFPEPAATSPRREQTTVAPQALFFLNHEFVAECARRLLRRPDVAALTSPDERIERIYRVLFSRRPEADELALAREYLTPDAALPAVAAWQYGYGAADESASRVKGFTPLRHWSGERWQAGPNLPDPKLGWVFIDRNGGHPAATLERCAIRRWTAPASGAIEIDGTLKHHPAEGNGVRARIVSSRHGLLGQWLAHHAQVETKGLKTTVEAGDTIDFVVDFHGHIIHDEHEWPVTIRLTPAPAESTDSHAAVWNSQKDFRGQDADRWLDFVHGLLMTNEFVFVD